MSSTLATRIAEANRVLLAEGNFDAIPDYFTTDYVVHLTDADIKATHDTIRDILAKIRERFSELEVEVKILLADENRVAWYRDIRGVQTGSYQGFPATDRMVKWRQMMVSEFRDGLISEEWAVSDMAEQLLLARKAKG